MIRSSILSLSLFAVAASAISVPSHTITQLDHKSRVFKLTSSHGSNVQFKVIDKPKSSRGSPNEGQPAGHLSSPSGWRPVTVQPTKWVHTSKQLYADNKEMKYNAQALLKRDVFPGYGDKPGNWLSQHGEHNWVTLEIQPLHEVTLIQIYETFNPGGITEVELLSQHSNRKVVYRRGWNNAVNDGASSGANTLRINVADVPFEVSYVRLTVDASLKWRGIDSLTVSGSVRQDTKLPGTLATNSLTYSPNGRKVFGCDEFRYAANAGRGWSAPGTIKVCFEAPKGKHGRFCSARGKVNQARCQCPAGWGGQACEVPLCPSHNNRMCSGVGSCSTASNPPRCKCPGGYFGNACQMRGTSRYCYACNDPHYVSFWGRRFDLYSTGEWVLHYWPGGNGHRALQIDHYVYRLYVDGASVRYGSDIVTWKWRGTHAGHSGLWVNCRRVGAGWHHTASGLRVYMTGGYFRAHIGNWMTYWMSTGCFGLTTLTGGPSIGMCNDRGWWHVPGSCRLFTCQRCGANQLTTLLSKQKEKITPIAAGKRSRSAPGYPMKFSHKLSDNIIPDSGVPDMPEELAAAGDDGRAVREATFVADDSDIAREGRSGGVAAKKLRGSRVSADGAKGKLSNSEKYIVNMMSVYAMDAGPDGKVDDGKVNIAIRECDPEILKGVMRLDKCLKFIGSEEFDDCVMDACLVAKNLKLEPKKAVEEAVKENTVADNARREVLREVDDQRKEIEDDKEEDRAANNEK